MSSWADLLANLSSSQSGSSQSPPPPGSSGQGGGGSIGVGGGEMPLVPHGPGGAMGPFPAQLEAPPPPFGLPYSSGVIDTAAQQDVARSNADQAVHNYMQQGVAASQRAAHAATLKELYGQLNELDNQTQGLTASIQAAQASTTYELHELNSQLSYEVDLLRRAADVNSATTSMREIAGLLNQIQVVKNQQQQASADAHEAAKTLEQNYIDAANRLAGPGGMTLAEHSQLNQGLQPFEQLFNDTSENLLDGSSH